MVPGLLLVRMRTVYNNRSAFLLQSSVADRWAPIGARGDEYKAEPVAVPGSDEGDLSFDLNSNSGYAVGFVER